MLFHVGDRTIDLARREVRQHDRRLGIEPKAFDLLVYLIANRDRLVTKDDLIADVWHGRIVSDSALASALNAARSALGDDGRQQRLIRTSARQGFRFVAPVTLQEAGGDPAVGPFEPSGMPAVAVMPFANLGGDAGEEYFVDGLVEDIVAAVARFKSVRVISRSASFTWKGKSYDRQQVGRRLGARYLLEGSIRKAKSNLRVAVHLMDSVTGTHVWADHFDGALEEVFELQDRIAAGVVGAIVPALTQAEMERARRKPVASLDAYESFLRGLALLRQFRKDGHAQARQLFYRAIELAPDFSTPYGFATHSYSTSKLHGWDFDPASMEPEVRRLAHQLAAVGPDDGWSLGAAGFSLAWICRDYDSAASFGDAAIGLIPKLAHAWMMRGAISMFCGEQALALDQFSRALAITPMGAELTLTQGYLAFSLLFVGRFEEAAHAAAHAAAHMPHWLAGHLVAAAAYAFLGNHDRARQSAATVRLINPGLRASYLRHSFGCRRPEDRILLEEGLRRAGLPD